MKRVFSGAFFKSCTQFFWKRFIRKEKCNIYVIFNFHSIDESILFVWKLTWIQIWALIPENVYTRKNDGFSMLISEETGFDCVIDLGISAEFRDNIRSFEKGFDLWLVYMFLVFLFPRWYYGMLRMKLNVDVGIIADCTVVCLQKTWCVSYLVFVCDR